jgi:hypothetical protein
MRLKKHLLLPIWRVMYLPFIDANDSQDNKIGSRPPQAMNHPHPIQGLLPRYYSITQTTIQRTS